MFDVYLMNKATGEIVPSEQVFQEFYKTHTISARKREYFTTFIPFSLALSHKWD